MSERYEKIDDENIRVITESESNVSRTELVNRLSRLEKEKQRLLAEIESIQAGLNILTKRI